MDEIDREVLSALYFKERVSIAVLADQIKISGEVLERHLTASGFLLEHDYVRVEWPIGNPKFLHITEKGRRSLWSRKKLMMDWLSQNWLLLFASIVTTVGSIASWISLFRR